MVRDAGQNRISTITLAFEAFRGMAADESPLAKEVAAQYGASHTTRWVGEREFHDDLPKIMAAMDQPTIDGINTWFVSKAANENGIKVAISGVGGDELLGGYSTFRNVPRMMRGLAIPSFVPGLAALVHRVVGAANSVGLGIHPKYDGLLRYGGSLCGAYLLQRAVFLPEELRDIAADREFLALGLNRLAPLGLLNGSLTNGPRSAFGKMAVLESSFYLRNQLLRDTDWASMAHSLEVRTPLVDHVLLRTSAAVMLGSNRPGGKALLAAAPLNPVPKDVVNRVKTGFGIPVEAWLAKMHPGDPQRPMAGRLFSREWAKRIARSQDALGYCGLK